MPRWEDDPCAEVGSWPNGIDEQPVFEEELAADDEALELVEEVSIVDVLKHYELMASLKRSRATKKNASSSYRLLLRGPSLFPDARKSEFPAGDDPFTVYDYEDSFQVWEDKSLQHQLGRNALALVIHLEASGSYESAKDVLRTIAASKCGKRINPIREDVRVAVETTSDKNQR